MESNLIIFAHRIGVLLFSTMRTEIATLASLAQIIFPFRRDDKCEQFCYLRKKNVIQTIETEPTENE